MEWNKDQTPQTTTLQPSRRISSMTSLKSTVANLIRATSKASRWQLNISRLPCSKYVVFWANPVTKFAQVAWFPRKFYQHFVLKIRTYKKVPACRSAMFFIFLSPTLELTMIMTMMTIMMTIMMTMMMTMMTMMI